jgi:hypothetical protein
MNKVPVNSEGRVGRVFLHFSASALLFSLSASIFILPFYGIIQTKILRKEKVMKKNSSIKSALVPCILAVVFISFSCVPATIEAQTDWGTQPAKPDAKAPAYTPPPDQMIYVRTGPKDKSVTVTATNFNVPGLPPNLTYFKDTDETLENIGYDLADNPARAAIQVRVTAKYTQVDPGQAVGNAVGRAATGAILGVLGGLVSGGGGQGAAQGAAGGAAYGVTGGSGTPTGLKYLTLEFEFSSKRGGTQTGRVTKDISDPTIRLEEFIDGAIGAYIEAALPNKR